MSFDISEDEITIYQAETEDHLTTLEDGLVRLEQDDRDPELLQAMFRAAHTIKGTAGMIGHKRLVEITHILENAFDAVRKDQLVISTQLIDLCLETVDILRALRDEVITNEQCVFDVTVMVETFRTFLDASIIMENKDISNKSESTGKKIVDIPSKTINDKEKNEKAQKKQNSKEKTKEEINLQIDISSSSVASAARAFQVLLVLQSSAKIIEMNPDQQTIESAAPVGHMSARIILVKDKTQFVNDLKNIPEIDRIVVQDEVIQLVSDVTTASKKQDNNMAEVVVSRLGEVLLDKKLITYEELKTVLEKQKTYPPDSAP